MKNKNEPDLPLPAEGVFEALSICGQTYKIQTKYPPLTQEEFNKALAHHNANNKSYLPSFPVTPLAETHPTVYYRKALFSKEIDFLITEKRITLAEAKLLIMRGFLFHLGLFLKDYSNKVEAKCRNRVRNKDEMFKGEEPHLVSFQIALGELYWENRIKSLNQLANALILSLHENCEDSSHIVLIQGIEKTMAALTEQQYINKSDKNQLLNQVFESVLGIMQALSENHPSLYIIKGRGDSFSPQGLDLLELTEAISVEKRPFVLSITAPGQETNKAYADAYASPYEEEEEEIKQLMEEKHYPQKTTIRSSQTRCSNTIEILSLFLCLVSKEIFSPTS